MDKQNLLELAKPHYNTQQVNRLTRAIDYSQVAHDGQKRESGDPYVTHPLSVAAILIEWQLDIDSVIAGVLHDTLEDTDTQLEDIESKFGKDVAFLVDGVTRVGIARSGMKNISTYLPKTRDNLSKLLIAISHDLRVILIKLADRLHNLRTLEYLPKERQQKIAQESIEVFAPLADRLGMGRVKIEIEEIAFSYINPKEYKRLKALIKQRVGKAHKQLEEVRRTVMKAIEAEGIKYQMDGRIKSTYSLYKKLRKTQGNIDDIYDLQALRIIVDSKEQCYWVLGLIHSLYQPVLTKIKDYISVPKPNGYQSLHTTVITPNQQIVEFQIRTKQMHDYAEHGLAASFHYNEQKLSKTYTEQHTVQSLPRNLRWVQELQEMVSQLSNTSVIEPGAMSIDLFSDTIFVYSPKGDIYDLPEGSCALDFAFAVHSDVGLHAFTAKINNHIAKLSTKLSNGDIVEINTRKNVTPKNDWLKHVKSTKARQRIRAFINSEKQSA